jgi:hypothetical protein
VKAASKRRAMSQKTRFEVFKRDKFTCQYCGAHPPGVLLHVDHILAVAAGGGNQMDNLITACAPCNLGKGARDLSVAPQSMADRAAETKEREEQLQGYQQIFEAKRKRLEDETWLVLYVLLGGNPQVRTDEFISTKRFIEKLGYHEVFDAAEIAVNTSSVHRRNLFKYFCGICWNRIREAEPS